MAADAMMAPSVQDGLAVLCGAAPPALPPDQALLPTVPLVNVGCMCFVHAALQARRALA